VLACSPSRGSWNLNAVSGFVVQKCEEPLPKSGLSLTFLALASMTDERLGNQRLVAELEAACFLPQDERPAR
jgi:hypothetical protein